GSLEERVLALNARDRMDCGGSPQIGCECFPEAKEADLSLSDELGQRSDRFLDRGVGVDAMLLIEVDRVDAEPAQARLARLPHILRPPADASRAALRVPHMTELCCQHDLVSASADRTP